MGTKKALTVVLLPVVLAGVAVMATPADDRLAVESTRGEVIGVAADAATFTVQPDGEDAASVTFHVDEHTKIIRDGEEAPLDEVSAGERVTVNYKRDGGKYVALPVGIG